VSEDGVVASALVLVEIAEVEALLAGRTLDGAIPPFSKGEVAYARSKSDPVRRLAARLAAKRAAAQALGGDIEAGDAEVRRGRYGPPSLSLSARAEERLRALGAARALVSLTHERAHAAASVLLVSANG
jgi:holo-[acyl-carrier protein] synthase